MIKKILLQLLNLRQDSSANQAIQLYKTVCERFQGKTLIIHQGFEPNWLEELLKQPGGGAHFRINHCQIGNNPSPIERFVLTQIVPLNLPFPLLLLIESETIWLRHLTDSQRTLLPSDIEWILTELKERFHCRFTINSQREISLTSGISLEDNRIDYL